MEHYWDKFFQEHPPKIGEEIAAYLARFYYYLYDECGFRPQKG